MKRDVITSLFLIVLACGVFSIETGFGQQSPTVSTVDDQRTLIATYCVGCHNQRTRTAGLALDTADMTKIAESGEVWEKIIRKVRAEMMPPPGLPRPDNTRMEAFAAFLESRLDATAAARPNPGRTVLHRLNRAEYGNAIRDLFGLEIDVRSLLPADPEAYGFDNIADSLGTSPALMDRYLSAALKISATVIGRTKISPTQEVFHVRQDLSQKDHIEGMPIGTRGGILVRYYFPVDGTYVIKPKLWKAASNQIGGLEIPEDLEVTIDGERVRLARFGGPEDYAASYEFATTTSDAIDKRFEVQLPVKAGPHSVGVAFPKKSSAPNLDLLQPFLRDRIDPILQAGIPQIDSVTIEGPFDVTGPGDSPSRRQILTCRPATSRDTLPCARSILSRLARRAYRRPVTEAEARRLLNLFETAQKKEGSFEAGIENALAFMLVNPEFLFCFESDPPTVTAGQIFHISDFDLASRLSFFIWSSIPDEQLWDLASQKKLNNPAILRQQVKRMLTDQRAQALVSNFAGQWLYLRNVKSLYPNEDIFPDFDDNLRMSIELETEMLFKSLVLEDRSVLDLLTADYTFVNERLAKHYGIPGIYGDQMRRVPVANQARRGLLGQASILTLTSNADRTSPVKRGQYILTNILGTPPPPPPPNVPPLNEAPDKNLTMRERMQQHRTNAVCASCHRLMDPVGLALENFDAIGRWRTLDNGIPIDPSDTLYNGSKVNGPVALREFILRHPEQFVRTMTEKLLTYALGRGIGSDDMPAVRSIVRDAASNDYRFSSIVLAVVKSVPFQMKASTNGSAASKQ